MHDLLPSGVIARTDQFAQPLLGGQLAAASWQSDQLPLAAEQLRQLKCDFCGMRAWPVTPSHCTRAGSHGISAAGGHPDAAWLVLRTRRKRPGP